MAYFYSDESRESDPQAQPDVEVFRSGFRSCVECGGMEVDNSADIHSFGCPARDADRDDGKGWFYAFGFPGCLWDSDPVGPFDTEAEALADAREGVE